MNFVPRGIKLQSLSAPGINLTAIYFYLFLSILFHLAGCKDTSNQRVEFLNFPNSTGASEQAKNNILFSGSGVKRVKDIKVVESKSPDRVKKNLACPCSLENKMNKWNYCLTQQVLARGKIENIIPARLTGRTIKFYLYIKVDNKESLFPGNGSYIPGTMKAIFKIKHESMDFSSPRAEVAAFKIAQLLNFNQVPPATFRRLSQSYLLKLLKEKDLPKVEKFKREIVEENDLITGAAVYFAGDVSNFEVTHLYTDWLFKKNSKKLSIFQKKIAKQLGKVIIFDYLTGNYDRFSGGNIMKDKTGKLLFIDHGAGFGVRREWKKKKNWELLKKLQRVPRDFINAVSRLSPAKIERCLKDTLSETQICEIISRKKKLLEYLDNKYKGSYYGN